MRLGVPSGFVQRQKPLVSGGDNRMSTIVGSIGTGLLLVAFATRDDPRVLYTRAIRSRKRARVVARGGCIVDDRLRSIRRSRIVLVHRRRHSTCQGTGWPSHYPRAPINQNT